MEKDLQIVGFRIGNETYGVRIGAVREIVRVPEITAVPSAPDSVEGHQFARQNYSSNGSAQAVRAHGNKSPDKKNRILVVELDNKLLGLIVNSASEVLKIPPSEIEAPQYSVFADGESGYVVTGVGKLERTPDHLARYFQAFASAGALNDRRRPRGNCRYRVR